jgi:nitrobindin-like protein
MITIELHPHVRPLAFLLGTWKGEGEGEYPTIEPFRYREEIHFWHNGKPFLAYQQRTQAVDDGRPLHAEFGFLRATQAGSLEFVITQAIGLTEIDAGTLSGTRLELHSTSVERTPTAKAVTGVRRSIWLEGDQLRYELAMQMATVPMTHHLSARFTRSA